MRAAGRSTPSRSGSDATAADRAGLPRDQGRRHGLEAALADIAEARRDPVARYLEIEKLHQVGKPPPWLQTDKPWDNPEITGEEVPVTVRIPPLDPLAHNAAYFNAVEKSPLHGGLLDGPARLLQLSQPGVTHRPLRRRPLRTSTNALDRPPLTPAPPGEAGISAGSIPVPGARPFQSSGARLVRRSQQGGSDRALWPSDAGSIAAAWHGLDVLISAWSCAPGKSALAYAAAACARSGREKWSRSPRPRFTSERCPRSP